MLNLFYEEPEGDRWLPWDRYPRRIVRRLWRGPAKIGGQKRVFVNLCAGLDLLGVRYRVNDYSHIQRHRDDIACIIGKPCVLDKIEWKNPILFGASVFAHPYLDPDLLKRLPVRKVLVPCEWMRKMFEPYYGNAVAVWPVGIDTELWKPAISPKLFDVLLYDKIRWYHDDFERTLIEPIRSQLKDLGLTFAEIRYGDYEEDAFRRLLQQCKSMVFLCEHESQGLALQQALSSGLPVLAWDRQGVNPDPGILAQGIRFGPVTPVPYWDARCGLTFCAAEEFSSALKDFWCGVNACRFRPRDFIVEGFTLERRAAEYVAIVDQVTLAEPAEVGFPVKQPPR